MKHVYACLSAGKDRESSFHLCAGPVMLVEACLCAANDQESSFQLCGDPIKIV